MAHFPEDWMQELLSRIDIVDIVGEYIRLKPGSGRMWGLCPFHGEKTASFSVERNKQLFYCFGCHMGGNVLHFIMQIEKMPFPEAVEYLAQRANLELPENVDNKAFQGEQELKKNSIAANREAALFYHKRLKESEETLEYLEKRGINNNTIVRFGLGYAPKEWDMLSKHLLEKGFSEDVLIKSGLSRRRDKRLNDYFRDRLIFPIISTGKQKPVIGFGGRILGSGEPKYLNTAETLVFNKRRQLYGLNLFKALAQNFVILTEGYMDVVSLKRNNIDNAVATLGTAITNQQARLLKRYTSLVYTAYDGDEAGQNATIRALDILKSEGLDAKVIVFPEGLDPDDFIKKYGKNGFEALLKKALNPAEFRIRRMAERLDLKSDDGRETLAREGSAYLAQLSPIEQERYFPLLSDLTQFSVAALRLEAETKSGKNNENTGNLPPEKNRSTNNRNTKGKENLTIEKDRLLAERDLVYVAGNDRDLGQKVMERLDLFKVNAHVEFLSALKNASPDIDAGALLSEISPDAASYIAAALSRSDIQEKADLHSIFDRAWRKLYSYMLREKRSKLQEEFESISTGPDRKRECLREIGLLGKELAGLDERKLSIKGMLDFE